MIYQRALLREIGNYAAAVFAALFAVTATSVLVRFLGRAAGGSIPLDAVLGLVGFTALNYLPILLAVTLFVSVLAAMSRSHRDSEMVIWSTAGLPLYAWVRPVMLFAVPLVLLVALLSLLLAPWANQRAQEYQQRLEGQEDVSMIAPGVFREPPSGNVVFFVESMSGEQREVQNVFIAGQQHGREGVVVSRHGYIDVTEKGDRYAVLVNGRRYEGVPGTPEYRIMEFERYSVLIQSRSRQDATLSPKALSTLKLLREPENRLWRAELTWRVGLPFVALNLALLAIPLSSVNPRATRSLNLIFAVLAYLVYSNLLSIVQAWVAQGRVPFSIGWWVLHAAMLALIGILFWRRTTLRFGLRLRR
ncbi:MAG: LPS export ABC transporter permease LptF [Burkholderiales bacterium]|nr:LPS export ABC transporter permease LptF [Burkholderiales bacterium]